MNMTEKNNSFAAAAGQAELNAAGLVAMGSAILGAVDKAHQTLDKKITDGLVAVNTDLQELAVQMADISERADTWGDAEKGQFEGMIKRILEQPAIQEAITALGVKIDGTSYSLTSIVKALATKANVVKEEVLLDAQSKIQGLKLFFDTGAYAQFDCVPVVAEGGKTATYTYSTADWFGLPASIVAKYTNLGKNLNYAGQVVPVDSWLANEISNLVIDIKSKFVAATGATIAVPDFNNNGEIGA
jgi:hypothetical protein